MSLKAGNTELNEMYLGSDYVKGITLGSTPVFLTNDVISEKSQGISNSNHGTVIGSTVLMQPVETFVYSDWNGYVNGKKYNTIVVNATITPRWTHTYTEKGKVTVKVSNDNEVTYISKVSESVTLSKTTGAITVTCEILIPEDISPTNNSNTLTVSVVFSFGGATNQTGVYPCTVSAELIGRYDLR